MRVPVVNQRRAAMACSRHGLNTGSGAPAQSSTRTGMRSARSASTSRRTSRGPERASTKSGVMSQPAMARASEPP